MLTKLRNNLGENDGFEISGRIVFNIKQKKTKTQFRKMEESATLVSKNE